MREELSLMGVKLDQKVFNGNVYVKEVMEAYRLAFFRKSVPVGGRPYSWSIAHVFSDGEVQSLHWHLIFSRLGDDVVTEFVPGYRNGFDRKFLDFLFRK